MYDPTFSVYSVYSRLRLSLPLHYYDWIAWNEMKCNEWMGRIMKRNILNWTAAAAFRSLSNTNSTDSQNACGITHNNQLHPFPSNPNGNAFQTFQWSAWTNIIRRPSYWHRKVYCCLPFTFKTLFVFVGEIKFMFAFDYTEFTESHTQPVVFHTSRDHLRTEAKAS